MVFWVALGGGGGPAAGTPARPGKGVPGGGGRWGAAAGGSPPGGARLIRQAYFEDPAYVPLVLRAYELWERLERGSGRNLLAITGALLRSEERRVGKEWRSRWAACT